MLSVSRQENELENERKREIRDQCFYFLPSFSLVLLRWHYYLAIVSVQIKDQSENMSVASSCATNSAVGVTATLVERLNSAYMRGSVLFNFLVRFKKKNCSGFHELKKKHL